LIGVVVPRYLAECLDASWRGRGTGIFQWLLTLGIFVASVIGYYFSFRVAAVARLGDAARLFAFEDTAWRSIFWVSLPPGIPFVIGSFIVAESPRWLFRRGKKAAARAALLRSRGEEQAEMEMKEMEETAAAEKATASGGRAKESLLHRKYVIPFALACVILACTQTTGVSCIISYNPTILIQAGLGDRPAHLGYVILTLVNFLLTMGGVMLVDRKGRKFLLSLGSGGIILSLLGAGILFHQTERHRVDVKAAVQAMVTTNQTLTLAFNQSTAAKLLAGASANASTLQRFTASTPVSLVVIYSYGDFRAATPPLRSGDAMAEPTVISRNHCVPANKVLAFFNNPVASLNTARAAPLEIDHALVTPVPGQANGWLTAICLFSFIAFFAVGPGVCVWLALSELMPTRIRSNGMSIALVLNQGISTTVAAIFLPTVGQYGYSAMFFAFGGCTVVYFITAAFFLPETRGKTLEEIEEHFEGGKKFGPLNVQPRD
jgi:hypothetical protein